MVVESIKWKDYLKLISAEKYILLAEINRNILIVLGCVVLVIVPLTIITAKKATKDVGWDVYKKIGSSVDIQSKYD